MEIEIVALMYANTDLLMSTPFTKKWMKAESVSPWSPVFTVYDFEYFQGLPFGLFEFDDL